MTPERSVEMARLAATPPASAKHQAHGKGECARGGVGCGGGAQRWLSVDTYRGFLDPVGETVPRLLRGVLVVG